MIEIHFDSAATGYQQALHPERPERLTKSESYLREQHRDWVWRKPRLAREEELLPVHSLEHLQRLTHGPDFDVDTPFYEQIAERARQSAGSAIEVTERALQGAKAFSLMRPPGHHASRERAMGFCYLNSIAIAAFAALQKGASRVAIWDFDAHHGNGTEAVVAGHSRIFFASVHQYPGYPGTGLRSSGNIHNWPVAPSSDPEVHAQKVRLALDTLIAFRPDLILVSAGFDAFAGDPITEMTLQSEHFERFGRWLKESDLPAAAILEGGYSNNLPRLIDAFLTAWE
jgi:acetoin utilization deacetylase AcuC-like enzyme